MCVGGGDGDFTCRICNCVTSCAVVVVIGVDCGVGVRAIVAAGDAAGAGVVGAVGGVAGIAIFCGVVVGVDVAATNTPAVATAAVDVAGSFFLRCRAFFLGSTVCCCCCCC